MEHVQCIFKLVSHLCSYDECDVCDDAFFVADCVDMNDPS